MPLKEEEYHSIRTALDASQNPLILHDDDPDGLCSYLLLKRYAKRGHGVMVKPKAQVDESHLKYIDLYKPDKVFIVDVAQVHEAFLDKVNLPVIWIDHHQLQEHGNAQYFNPRKHNQEDNEPATYLCYHAVKQDLWIAAVGSVADWQLTDVATEFARQRPDILSPDIQHPGEAMFATPLGKLIRFFSFIMKGNEKEAYRNIALLEHIENPDELLNPTTPAAKEIASYCNTFETEYQNLLKEALAAPEENSLTCFFYKNKHSFTGELANELLYRRPNSIIIVGREKEDRMRMSLRGGPDYPILPRLKKTVSILNKGQGGGHLHACGASIGKQDLDAFIEVFKEAAE